MLTHKLTELKVKMLECWDEITVLEISSSISSWKKRLRAVLNKRSAPIDHNL